MFQVNFRLLNKTDIGLLCGIEACHNSRASILILHLCYYCFLQYSGVYTCLRDWMGPERAFNKTNGKLDKFGPKSWTSFTYVHSTYDGRYLRICVQFFTFLPFPQEYLFTKQNFQWFLKDTQRARQPENSTSDLRPGNELL